MPPRIWLNPHRRFNPLLKKWVLVSPHRTARPWQGESLNPVVAALPTYDPGCYLCPGNVRANGETNPHYHDVFSFPNDYSALLPGEVALDYSPNEFVRSTSASGICKVICFSPEHNVTIAEMPVEGIERVIVAWQKEYAEISANPEINYVTIFENKGAAMGCSNPHPHGQIWASNYIPSYPKLSYDSQSQYSLENNKNLLNEYAHFERSQGERVVFENQEWIALVPFWAEWPFEVMIVPLSPVRDMGEISATMAKSWAEAIKVVTVKYDQLFQTSFPYSMGIYQRPCDGGDWEGACLYQVFLPPLLRSASVRKYMVGFEMIAESQRDLTPEVAAQRLRECGIN